MSKGKVFELTEDEQKEFDGYLERRRKFDESTSAFKEKERKWETWCSIRNYVFMAMNDDMFERIWGYDRNEGGR